MIDNYVLYNNSIKEIDLHGYDRYTAAIAINEFIKDNYKLKIRFLRIIHGKGLGVLKKTSLEVLKNNKLVEDYKIDIFNDGCTIVLLKEPQK